MQESDNSRFIEAVDAMVRQYPGAKWSTENNVAYWAALADQPLQAVLLALKEAPVSSPQFVPPAPMLRVIATRRAVEIRAEGEQLLLDGILPEAVKTVGRPDREKALQEFYRLCDDALDKSLGEQITGENQHVIEGLVIVLGAVYGFRRETMSTYARGLRYTWSPGVEKTGKQLNIPPGVVVHGLQKVPGVFTKFPTEGMLRELIHGESVSVWPDEWLTDAARALRPRKEAAQPGTIDFVAAAIDAVVEHVLREPGSEG